MTTKLTRSRSILLALAATVSLGAISATAGAAKPAPVDPIEVVDPIDGKGPGGIVILGRTWS